MDSARVQYAKGYKYQLRHVFTYRVGVLGFEAKSKYIQIATNGQLTIRDGYAWDGPSGPAVDTKSFMRASLVHDALYQLMREGKLPQTFRPVIDETMHNICIADGMWKIRAWWCLRAVSKFAAKAASIGNVKKVCIAP